MCDSRCFCDPPVTGWRKSRVRTRVGCCCAMRQAGGQLWREIREVPLLRCVCEIESDELTNYRHQVAQAQRSIHTDISRNRRQSSEIRNSENWNNRPSKIAVLTCILEIHKTQAELNGVGTFGLLVTLKKHEHKNALQGWRGLSWRTDYD